MQEEDFADFNMMGAEFMGERGATGYLSEKNEKFYNKLEEYNSSWLDLESLSYKCTKIAKVRFSKEISQMTQEPDLQYYKVAVSRNGGPIALMLKEDTLFFGKKDDTKNFIFILSSYGKLIKTIDVSFYFIPIIL